MRRAGLLALALGLLAVPSAGSAGITFSYSITSGTVGDNGWYRSAVTVSISVVGATDTTCPSVKTFRANNDPPLDCTATDGNGTIPFHLDFNIDTDPPTVTSAAPNRAADANGWFNQPVTLTFAGSDATSGVAACSTATYSGPDSAAAAASGTCRDNAGNLSAPLAAPLKYDATPPVVSPSLGRPADAGGWYSHPVPAIFAGTDATSGIDSCTGSQSYSGPDTQGTSLAGSCVDRAGNRADGSVQLRYDATPPRLEDVTAVPGPSDVTLTWKPPVDVASVAVTRSPDHVVYKGKATRARDTGLAPGTDYHYRLTSVDEAGNQSVAQVTVTLRTLYAPALRASAHAGTALRWTSDDRATYYNLQLYLRGHKVLSTWPAGTSFQLPRSWRYEGRRHRLVRGTYRWFVWPGRGPRARAQYGPLLGKSTFVVR